MLRICQNMMDERRVKKSEKIAKIKVQIHFLRIFGFNLVQKNLLMVVVVVFAAACWLTPIWAFTLYCIC